MKTSNKYDPQTCNRTGEAERRLKTAERVVSNRIVKSQNFHREMAKQYNYTPIRVEDIHF